MKITCEFKLFIKYWLPFLLWAVIIYSFSSNPTVSTSEVHWQDFVIKKTAHVIEYFIFTLLLYRALRQSKIKNRRAVFLAILVAFVYGMSDEFHQSFTPGREPKIRDVLIDTSGSLLFFLFLYKIAPRNKNLTELLKMLQLT
jgi:VanZ family protein